MSPLTIAGYALAGLALLTLLARDDDRLFFGLLALSLFTSGADYALGEQAVAALVVDLMAFGCLAAAWRAHCTIRKQRATTTTTAAAAALEAAGPDGSTRGEP